jgi:hypothetical protein
MLATLRSNISDLLRRPLDIIVIGGLGMMVLLCMISDMITWPLVPTNSSELSGTWKITAGPLKDTSIFFEAGTAYTPSGSYTFDMTAHEIRYFDGRSPQSYRFGRPLSSLVIMTDRHPLLVVTTPGPIPVGVYTHQVFTSTSGPHP